MKFNEHIDNVLKQFKKLIVVDDSIKLSEGLLYCLQNNLALYESPYRIYSNAYFSLIQEARSLYENNLLECTDEDAELLESDIGYTDTYNGVCVYLDAPFVDDQPTVDESSKHKKPLNKPFRTPGGPKKFAVYVRSKSGGVKKVTFGDPNLKIKNSNAARAKSFRARHKCNTKKDKTTAGYWSCNVGRYAKSLGLKSSTPW